MAFNNPMAQFLSPVGETLNKIPFESIFQMLSVLGNYGGQATGNEAMTNLGRVAGNMSAGAGAFRYAGNQFAESLATPDTINLMMDIPNAGINVGDLYGLPGVNVY